jgi:Cdc6-like AAA superfamily ATPase
MALRAKAPEAKQKRLKMFVYGPSGVGKTTAAIMFPNAVIIDTEKGTDFYADTINKMGSVVFQTSIFDEAVKEVKELMTTKHDFRTVVIDPVTQLYNSCQEKYTRIFEKHAKTEKEAEVQDFGMRYWGRVKSDFKAFQRMLLAIDTNIIVLSHQKDQYGTGMAKIGVTFDSMKGEDYLYDLVFRLENRNGKRYAVTVKERAEIGKAKFPPEFEWSYENFKKFYGADIIEKESTPIALATPEQLAKIKHLLDIVKMEEGTVAEWFSKADVSEWSEMTTETIGKCITFIEKKLTPATAAK